MSLNLLFRTSVPPQVVLKQSVREMKQKMEKSTPLVVTSSGPTNLPPSIESRIR